jgi:hypothetical protein
VTVFMLRLQMQSHHHHHHPIHYDRHTYYHPTV